ncbi:LacI family DNA-binding transcriptional regulator [Enterococcus faecalis]|uniref:LacI family DNA-binding transcriptional regulator n=1 Tax=Enterococcus TaxID=1350 RepID=UPI003A900A91
MVNIRTLAEMTGVSKSTVSRVINNEKYVSDEIRKKVQYAIEQTNYVSNGNAVKLSKGKNDTLGVTLPYNNSCYDQLVNTILYQAKVNGYQVLLLPTYYEEETESNYYSLLEKKMIDGLILTSRTKNLDNLEKLNLKGKIVSTEKINNHQFSMIYPDRKSVYDHLFLDLHKKGVSEVIFTTKRAKDQSQSTMDKVESYERYFGEAIEGRDYFIGIEDYTDGYNWAVEIGNKRTISGFIYANGDDTAAGIISGMEKIGLVHKKDYHVIGEGNLPYSRLLNFSTIDFLPEEIGESVVDFILSGNDKINVSKQPKIIIR